MIQKKRGRRTKKDDEKTGVDVVKDYEVKDNEEEPENVVIEEDDTSASEPDTAVIVPKKRGRKPKGGKIVQQMAPANIVREPKPNVILHLKCSLKDLQSTNMFGGALDGFSFSSHGLTFNPVIADNEILMEEDEVDERPTNDAGIREIWKKLKQLEHNLHVNNVDNKKSACFWDTCEFDNPPVYIPKYYMNDTYHVYGCFCSPECAVAHLMEENIDSSVKFERYQLINHLYSKIYNYTKNVKPAPNPFYMLEKYYGNLTIQEYRALLRNERLFLVVDKPLTRVMPELHEDNDDFIMNNKIIPTNNIKLRKTNKKPTKTNILSERFGLVQS